MSWNSYLAATFAGPAGTPLAGLSTAAPSGGSWPDDPGHFIGSAALDLLLDGANGIYLAGGAGVQEYAVSSAKMSATFDFELIVGFKRYTDLGGIQQAELVLACDTGPFSFSGGRLSLAHYDSGFGSNAGFAFWLFTSSANRLSSGTWVPAVGTAYTLKIVASTSGGDTTFKLYYSTDGGGTYTDAGIGATTPTPALPVAGGLGFAANGAGAWSATTGPHILGPLVVQDPSATTATLAPPPIASGAVGQQSAAITVGFDRPVGYGGVTVAPSSTLPGTFQASAGGADVAAFVVPQGSTSATFYFTPAAAGSASISIATSGPSLTIAGSPVAYTVPLVGGIYFDSWVSGLTTGQAANARVIPRAYDGTKISVLPVGTYSVGQIAESPDEPGAYGCRVQVLPAYLPAGTTLRVAWSVGGQAIVDPAPQPASSLLDGGLTWGQAINQLLAGIAGMLSNVPTGGPGILAFKDPTGVDTRIAMGVDGSGNRTSIVHNPPVA